MPATRFVVREHLVDALFIRCLCPSSSLLSLSLSASRSHVRAISHIRAFGANGTFAQTHFMRFRVTASHK